MAAPSVTHFKRLPHRKQAKLNDLDCTPESEYWNSFDFPVIKKEYGPVTDVQFSPVEPHEYLTVSSTRVHLYSSQTNNIHKTFTKFRELVHCARIRSNGKLMLAGTDNGIVKVFDISHKNCLRTLNNHSSAVHSASFLIDGLRVLSCGDDRQACVWDISSGDCIQTYTEFQDSVRCCSMTSSSRDIIITGCYDHKARMFDVRSNDCVQAIDHGSPIEDILYFPSGSIYLTAGGPIVKVWDALAGGKLITELKNHHKHVMSMCLSNKNQKLLTASLDKHVKVYDISTYQPVHTLDYPAPILSVACSPDDKCLAVGMADGMVSVRKQRSRGQLSKAEARRQAFQKKIEEHSFKPSTDAHFIQHKRREHLAKYDKLLKQFQHSKALDAVLETGVRLKTPEVTVALIEELIRRDTLTAAIAGRDEDSLDTLLRFCTKNITNQNFSQTIVDVVNVILDVYMDQADRLGSVLNRLQSLKHSVDGEIRYEEQLLQLMGTMDAIISMSQKHEKQTEIQIKPIE